MLKFKLMFAVILTMLFSGLATAASIQPNDDHGQPCKCAHKCHCSKGAKMCACAKHHNGHNGDS